MKSIKESGYALVSTVVTVLTLGTAAVLVPVVTNAGQQSTSSSVTSVDVSNAQVQAPVVQDAPAIAPVPVQAPTGVDYFNQTSAEVQAPASVSESIEAPQAVPSSLTKSAGQKLSLILGGSPMFADVTATKSAGTISVDMTYSAGIEPMDPEIFFRVGSITCADGSVGNANATLAYGQWNGHKARPVIQTNNLSCDPISFTLEKFTESSSSPYWTINQTSTVTFVS